MGLFLSVLLVLTFLTSCSESSFVNLAVFIENFNSLEDEEILDFPDFTVSTGSGGETVYTRSFEKDGHTVLLRLTADDDKKITACRVVIPKRDKTGKKLKQSDERQKFFAQTAEKTICAFTLFDDEKSKQIISSFDLSNSKTLKNEGEITKEEEGFYFIYLSNSLCSEFIIKNIWLCEIESTLKPESKGGFIEGTGIRTDTVPLE